jgi:hypothetical protein
MGHFIHFFFSGNKRIQQHMGHWSEETGQSKKVSHLTAALNPNVVMNAIVSVVALHPHFSDKK